MEISLAILSTALVRGRLAAFPLRRLGLLVALLSAVTAQAEWHSTLFPIGVAWKWGYVNAEGRVVVEPGLEDAGEFYGRRLAGIKKNGQWGAIDREGRIAIEPKYERLDLCGDDKPIAIRLDGKWGYIDEHERILIKPKYGHAMCFGRDGLAAVKVNGKWGLIDAHEHFVIEPKFDEVFLLSPGEPLAPARLGGKEGYADAHGNWAVKPIYDRALGFEGGLATVRLHDKWGLIDNRGRIVVEPKFDDLVLFSTNGLAAVALNGKGGYIDRHGATVIAPQYDRAGRFASNGLAAVSIGGKAGYIDAKGRFAIEPRFESARDFDDTGRAAVRIDGKWGYIDGKGVTVIPPRYETAYGFRDVLAKVELHGKMGYIDVGGRLVAMPFEGCGTGMLVGEGDAVAWAPKGVSASEAFGCIAWANAIRELDMEGMRALLARNMRPANINAALNQVIDVSSPYRVDQVEERRGFTHRQVEVVKLLIANGANPNEPKPGGTRFLLPRVIAWQSRDLALALIELGADVNQADCPAANPDCGADPLLVQALRQKDAALVRAMLDHHADPNGPDQQGMPPLLLTQEGDTESIQTLLNHGAKICGPAKTFYLVGQERKIGPVTWTIQARRDDLLQVALAQFSRDLDPDDKYAVAVAVEQNRPQVVRSLLDRKADPNLVAAANGGTLLHLAASQGYTEVARELIRAGAKIDARTLPVAHCSECLLRPLWDSESPRYTPLMLAARRGHPEMVKLLLENGADVSEKTAPGRTDTALTLTSDPEVVRILVEHGAKSR